jgi:hypothetical protein
MTKKTAKERMKEYEFKFFEKMPGPFQFLYMLIRFGAKEALLICLGVAVVILIWKTGYDGERLKIKGWDAPVEYKHGKNVE